MHLHDLALRLPSAATLASIIHIGVLAIGFSLLRRLGRVIGLVGGGSGRATHDAGQDYRTDTHLLEDDIVEDRSWSRFETWEREPGARDLPLEPGQDRW